MTLDDDLVHKAEAAGARLVEAERNVLLTRAEYHTLIRRVHLAGGSLREIGRALKLSHQRVQQIVDGAGGSWWQRVWRSRNATLDAVCTFCQRPPSEVAKLIAGPNVYICDSCIAIAQQQMSASGRSAAPGQFALVKPGAKTACSFCKKRRAADRAVVAGPSSSVCQECLGLCKQILDDRGEVP